MADEIRKIMDHKYKIPTTDSNDVTQACHPQRDGEELFKQARSCLPVNIKELNARNQETTDTEKNKEDQKFEKEKSAKDRYIRYSKALEALSLKVKSFWLKHPVERLETIQDESLSDGQIQQSPTPSKKAAKLADPFEWVTCDLKEENSCSEVAELLMEEGEYDGMLVYTYTNEYLRWALRTPDFFQGWHLGIKDKNTSKLVAFIGAIPVKVKMNDEIVDMVDVKFFQVSKGYRCKGLSQSMIRELSRRAVLKNYSQAIYSSGAILPTPLTTIKYRSRVLNPQNLKDSGLALLLPEGRTVKETNRLYRLPNAASPGFRKMVKTDVTGVTRFLKTYLGHFQVARDFTEKEVEHMFLPREDVVDSYVQVNTEKEVTGLISFYILALTIFNQKKRNTTSNSAFSYYAATETSLSQLIKDALTIAKKTCDIFFATDAMMMMDSDSVLQDLKFERDGANRYVYLYNRRLRGGVKASQLALGTL